MAAPLVDAATPQGLRMGWTLRSGYNANIDTIAEAPPNAGFFNATTDADGVVCSLPLFAKHQKRYYESLSLGMFRLLMGLPRVTPDCSHDSISLAQLDSPRLQHGSRQPFIPMDARGAVLVPFLGSGGPDRTRGGSYRYVSATDALSHRLSDGTLRDKIVLVGTTAPGLLDLLRVPQGETHPA